MKTTDEQLALPGPVAPRGVRPQTYAAPMSFVGSTRRMMAWAARPVGEPSPNSVLQIALAVLKWATVASLLLIIWCFIACWYVIAFGVFGIFVIPFRLFRRAQRKQEALAKAQLEVLEQMRDQNRRR